MSRRLIPIVVLVLLAIFVAASGLLSNVIAGDQSLTEWLKHQLWYSVRNALLALALLVAIIVALQYLQQASTKPKGLAREGPSLPIDPSVRLDLLNKIETEWVHDRLHQGLRNAIRVDLKLTETLAAVRPMLRIHTIAESGQPDERQTDDDIRNIFQKANGRLLILGEPGTGKTNLLLELAASLIAEARLDPALPIPIVFSLPRWTLGNRVRSLADWLIDDLADVAQYGLSRTTATSLVCQNRITPLLDGLDEVAEERRAACVEALHAYQQARDLGKLAVCCRISECEKLPKLNLRTAIRVEKLTRAEVQQYISMDRLSNVRRALEGDPQLWEIIDTPLWLHVAVLAAEVEQSAGGEAMPPRDRMYERFMRYALGREAEGSPRKRTAEKPLEHWLGWLAVEMKQRAQTQFSLEELDDSWLPTQRAGRWLTTLFVGLIVGLIFGLINGFFGGLFFGLFNGLLFGLVVGVFGGWLASWSEPIEELHFAWYRWRENLFMMAGGLIVGLVLGLRDGFALGLTFGLAFGLFAEAEAILQPKPVSGRSLPNRGTLRSLRYAATLLLLGFALATGTAALPLPLPLKMTAMYLIFSFAARLACIKGGVFGIRHYTIRLLLWRYNLAPLPYVRFLNEASDRLFLMRRGGSYEFFHATFRDYMADTYGSESPSFSLDRHRSHRTPCAMKPNAQAPPSIKFKWPPCYPYIECNRSLKSEYSSRDQGRTQIKNTKRSQFGLCFQQSPKTKANSPLKPPIPGLEMRRLIPRRSAHPNPFRRPVDGRLRAHRWSAE
jgi:hypothetical protein